MIHAYAKSNIGYSHIKDKKPCQDYSALYRDKERIIITCCDGHGGDAYIRSEYGSKIASYSIMNVFNSLNYSFFYRLSDSEIENQIKLNVLCEWNKMVEQHLTHKPIRKSEVIKLSEDSVDALKFNPAKAYGTTLAGAMLIGKKLVVVSIGDTECLYVSKGELMKVFNTDDDPVANVTYSMCQEDAFQYIRVKVLDFKNIDAVILCTDGLTSPYQSYVNFSKSFVNPLMNKLISDGNFNYVDNFIEELALKLGVGDDVSLSVIARDDFSKKYYK